jgi:hypothetical protein
MHVQQLFHWVRVDEPCKTSHAHVWMKLHLLSGLSFNDRARAGCSALSNLCNPNPKMLCHDAVTWNQVYTADHNFSSGSKFQSTLLGLEISKYHDAP